LNGETPALATRLREPLMDGFAPGRVAVRKVAVRKDLGGDSMAVSMGVVVQS